MKYILTSLVAVSLLAGCKKADEQRSSEDVLRGGAWNLRSGTVTYYDASVSAYQTDQLLPLLDDCEKDNTLTFLAGIQGTESFGSNLCSSGGGDLPFEWSLFNGDNSIRIYNAEESFQGNGSIDAELLTLTSNRFTIRYQEIFQDPTTSSSDTATIVKIYGR